jgi:hypothetical protein
LFFISHDPSATDTELAQYEKALQHKLSNKLSLAWAKEGTSYIVDTQTFSAITTNKKA